MQVIGLTGPSGSGKGRACELLKKLGIPSVDTDRVYHELLIPPSECLDDLVGEFGDIILTDGHLNRKQLAEIVFSDKSKLAKLNSITHKYILSKTGLLLDEFEKQGYKCALVDAPALFESGFDKKCDFVIAVIADRDIRAERIGKRDGLSKSEILNRINAQHDNNFYISQSGYTVTNNGSDRELYNQLISILKTEGLNF